MVGQHVPSAAVKHYKTMQRLQVVALSSAYSAWKNVNDRFVVQSWKDVVADLAPIVSEVQRRAASAGSSYNAETLVQTSSVWIKPEGFVDPSAFAGVSSSGIPIDQTLLAPAYHTLSRIGGGATVSDALDSGRSYLAGVIQTQIADAGRVAAGVDAASRAGVGYIRMLNPPSCERCAILAGRRYLWNQGFQRHPRCDCIHVLASKKALSGAQDEGLLVDQYAYFDSLSEREQDRIFGKAGAAAIRDGGDMNRIVNARRGMSAAGDRTSVLSSGKAKARAGLSFSGPRLTPEAIYKKAASREEAVDMLKRYGYMMPGASPGTAIAGGELRGWDYIGYGQMGRGGTRKGASRAVDAAIASGRRDPSELATMTAAESRVARARINYEAVLRGDNPYSRSRPLTPELSARVEREYRMWLTTNGEIFTD